MILISAPLIRLINGLAEHGPGALVALAGLFLFWVLYTCAQRVTNPNIPWRRDTIRINSQKEKIDTRIFYPL